MNPELDDEGARGALVPAYVIRPVGVPKAPGNPPGNALTPGVSVADVVEAVVGSGYPLQTVIGACLRRRMSSLAEEWAYVDADTNETRTLDLLAGKGLQPVFSRVSRGELTTRLTLLVECKQAELPYVAFQAVTRPEPASFPRITGLPVSHVRVGGDDKRRYIELGIPRFLGLNLHRFAPAPPLASSLSGVVRKGKRLELTGEQPYRSLILPLTKALEYFASTNAVETGFPESGGRWVSDLAVPIGVIDAPLVLAESLEERAEISLVPWIRVLRRLPAARRSSRPRVTLVDIVHKDFFDDYLTRYLTPYARVFQRRLEERADLVLSFDPVQIPGLNLKNPPRDLYRMVSAHASSG